MKITSITVSALFATLTTSVAAFTPSSLVSLARTTTTTTSSASRSSSGGVTAFGLVRRARASSSLAMAGPYEPDPNFDYDMVVIGGGSGGVRASRMASVHGAKVLLLEGHSQHGPPHYSAIGGTCVNVGCVPKKLMVFASRYPSAINEMTGYGWDGATPGIFSWDTFMAAKNEEITRLNNVYAKFVLGPAGVETIEGLGSLNGKNSVDISLTAGGTKTVSAKNILIAVGGWPFKPDIPGIQTSP